MAFKHTQENRKSTSALISEKQNASTSVNDIRFTRIAFLLWLFKKKITSITTGAA